MHPLTSLSLAQAITTIKFDVRPFHEKPKDDVEWHPVILLPEEIGSGTYWADLKHFPCVYEVGELDQKWHLFAVADSVFEHLNGNGFAYSQTGDDLPEGVPWRPRRWEIQRFGEVIAKSRAKSRFVRNAVDGILTHASGLRRFYERITEEHIKDEIMAALE